MIDGRLIVTDARLIKVKYQWTWSFEMQPGQGEQQPGQGQQQPRGGDQLRGPTEQDRDRGCACTLFAVVNADGSLARDFRAVSSRRFSRGQYEVVFNRNVARCAYVATIGDSGDDEIPPSGEVAVAGRFGDNEAVFIATYDSDGRPANRGFHLAVHCRPSN